MRICGATRVLGIVAVLTLALAGCGGGSAQGTKDTGGVDTAVPLDVPGGTDVASEPGDRDVSPLDVAPEAAPDVQADLGPLDVPPVDPGVEEGPDAVTPPDETPDVPADLPVDAGPCVVGATCDDGDPCTVDDRCDGDGKCAGTPVPACDDGLECTRDSCSAADRCDHALKPGWCLIGHTETETGRCFKDGAPDPDHPCRSCIVPVDSADFTADDNLACDDQDSCTTGDHCLAGACVATPVPCDDQNVCTRDRCDAGSCVHDPLDGVCDDGNLCTITDRCVGGTCAGQPVTCDDGIACTRDACKDGLCAFEPVNAACDDGNPCTDDVCEPGKGCVHRVNSAPCDDGNGCTVGDTCAGGACAGGTNECPCGATGDCAGKDDGDLCNGTLACLGGFCVVDPATVVACPAGTSPCATPRCNPSTGTCADVANADGLPCDDGSRCSTGDACLAGACVGGNPVECDDGNPCTDDSCDPAVGCLHDLGASACDDGDPCSTGDTCAGGHCVGIPLACDDFIPCTRDACTDGTCTFSPVSEACDDGNPCTQDVCDPIQGCIHPAASGACDDGNPCTETDNCVDGACVGSLNTCHCTETEDCVTGEDGDVCNGTLICVDGWCVVDPATVVRCGAPDDPVCNRSSCNPATGECSVVAVPDGFPCNDQTVCTKGETCVAGQCSGTALGCDDGLGCTLDSCDAVLGCVHLPDASSCDDGNLCTDDQCDPLRGCVHVPNSVACDDGNACTVGDVCRAGACTSGVEPLACDDGNLCTEDGCVPAKGCVHIPNTVTCDDGDPCTVGDRCKAAACVPGPNPLPCDDGNLCTDDACVPKVGCVSTPNAVPCDDANACTVGDTCGLGACQPGILPLECVDGNLCTDDSCDPATGCVFAPNAVPCDDNNPCTVGDACAAAACVPGTGKPDCDDGLACTVDFCSPSVGCDHRVSTDPACRPVLVIDYPPRGATLDGERLVTVQGHVVFNADGPEKWPVTSLVINGAPTAFDPLTGAFTFPIDSAQGMNPIVADVTDWKGMTDHVVQSYYYSTTWYPVDEANPAQSMVGDGLMVFLGPDVWDSNGAHTDIAGLMESYVQNLDFNGLITNPVTSGKLCLIPNPFGGCISSCSYQVNIRNITHGPVAVDLVPVDGGLYMKMTMTGFGADIDISGCSSPSGRVTASSIVVETTLAVSVDANGDPVVTMSSVNVTINNLDVSLDGVLGFLTNWLIGFFEGTFTNMLEDQLKSQLSSMLPGALRDALMSLKLDQTFDVPALLPGGTPVTLAIKTKFSSIYFSHLGGVLGLAATVTAPHVQTHAVLGSIGRASCLTGVAEAAPAFPAGAPDPTPRSLELGLHDDLLNQIPFGLYWGGGLTFPVGADTLGGTDLSAYGITDLTLDVDFWLAPILTTCNAASQLVIQMGDIGIHANMKLFGSPVDMQVFTTLEAPAQVTTVQAETGTQLSILVGTPTFIDLEIASLTGGLASAQDTLSGLVKEQLIPQILGAFTGKALGSFPIPTIDLGAANPAFAGKVIAIDLREVLRVRAYTVLSGYVK